MRSTYPSAALILMLAVFPMVLLGGCDGADTDRRSDAAPAPEGEWAYLYQREPGTEASIRLRLQQPRVPLRDQIFAWLFYRSADQRYFSLTATRLVDVWFESVLPGGTWDDRPAASGPFERSADFSWRGPDGSPETGSMEFVYHAPGMQPGTKYYHRVRRVVEPMARAGTGAPIAAGGVNTTQFVPLINVDPSRALSEGSVPTRGVTYFTPPTLQEPARDAVNQPRHRIRFTWSGTIGANEYVLQVFRDDDPGGRGVPLYQVTGRHDTTGTISETIEGNFAPGTRFYWRVGARRAGDPLPVNGLVGRAGWLFSEMRTFTTAVEPPPAP